MKIGNKLRVFRTEKGYTQEKIADLLQISQASYSNLENNIGKVDLKTIQKISEIYEIDLVPLLNQDGVNFNQNLNTSNNDNIINQLTEKLIEQYETRLKEKDKIIAKLKSRRFNP
jgi:transcriptional regulator with XRE-family HTH domain